MDSNQSSFSNILFNIIIPVFILNKGSKYGLSPLHALIIALSFPLIFGLYSLYKEKKVNFISVLGLLNILFSGILTLMALEGIWFAVKEAIFPLLIGVFVWFSSFSDKPFFQSLFLNPSAFNVDVIQDKIREFGKDFEFKELMKKSTQWLSVSFLLSAILNFSLALYIFTPIASDLAETEKQDLLNQQLSQMTMYSMFVILIPMMLFVGVILFKSFKKVSSLTQLKMEELFKT